MTRVPTRTPTADAPDEAESAPLDVDLDGQPLLWTKADVARVTRAGGTHDMRELAAALLGRTDVSVSVTGQTWRGPGTASVDLKLPGPDDELRIWPESDGTEFAAGAAACALGGGLTIAHIGRAARRTPCTSGRRPRPRRLDIL